MGKCVDFTPQRNIFRMKGILQVLCASKVSRLCGTGYSHDVTVFVGEFTEEDKNLVKTYAIYSKLKLVYTL